MEFICISCINEINPWISFVASVATVIAMIFAWWSIKTTKKIYKQQNEDAEQKASEFTELEKKFVTNNLKNLNELIDKQKNLFKDYINSIDQPNFVFRLSYIDNFHAKFLQYIDMKDLYNLYDHDSCDLLLSQLEILNNFNDNVKYEMDRTMKNYNYFREKFFTYHSLLWIRPFTELKEAENDINQKFQDKLESLVQSNLYINEKEIISKFIKPLLQIVKNFYSEKEHTRYIYEVQEIATKVDQSYAAMSNILRAHKDTMQAHLNELDKIKKTIDDTNNSKEKE